MKKIIGVLLTAVLLLGSMSSAAFAADNSKNQFQQGDFKLKEVQNVIYDENGKVVNVETITGEKALQEYLAKQAKLEKEAAEVNAIYNSKQGSVITPNYLWEKYVVRSWTSSWRQHLRTNQGGPGGSVNASVNEGFSTAVSATTSVSNGVISAGIGITVTSSINVIQGFSHDITPGKYGYIDVGVNWNRIYFDIYEKGILSDSDIGDGSYAYVTGASFHFYES